MTAVDLHGAHHNGAHHTGAQTRRRRRTGIPPALTIAVEDFKAAMQAADRALIAGEATDDAVQLRVDIACNTMTHHLRVHTDAHNHAEVLGAYVFRETFPYFALSTLIDRSYVKPRGYAGDYLTLQMVYDDTPSGVLRLGPFIDRWFLAIPASRAVKNRRGLLRDLIVDVAARNPGRPTAVTSLACGPLREVFDVLAADAAPDITVTGVDIDDDALAYATGIARRHGVRDRVSFARANIIRLARGSETLALPEQDLIYSIGLIDYLRDDVVIALLDWIHGRLRPGGTAVVGNFDTGNPDKAFMDHVLDWRLFHRTAEDLVDLFGQSAFGTADVDIRVEETGINLFAVAQRNIGGTSTTP